ncbi:hypothetical protein ACQ5ES_06635 [Pseudidiomarina sp. E22-M8]|uniref:hypothetical protein n=1 Tax=Pseudidiomarina sp. E22-M8 TaxID=3424768 RepID=UPI00403D07A4
MRFLLASLLAAFLIGCNPPQDDVVIVGSSWMGAMPIYTIAATDPQALPDGLKTIMLVSDNSVIHMLGIETVGGAFVTLDNALSVNTFTGGDYCVAMVLDRSVGADAVIVSDSWDWQAGETLSVGLEESTVARYMLSRWLLDAQIPKEAVTTQVLLPTQHIEAFTSGKIDAIVTYQPFIEHLRNVGGKVIFDSAVTNISVVDVLILRKAVWSAAAPLVEELKERVWPQALKRLQQRDEPFWQGLKTLTGISGKDLERALAGVEFVHLSGQEAALDQLFASDIPAVSNYLVASGMQDSVAPLSRCGGER